MADKKNKHKKNGTPEQLRSHESGGKQVNVSDAFLDVLKGAFTKFEKIEAAKRIELYGNKDYLDQFRSYFTKEYPNLLDTLNRKDLPIYIKALENKGFSIKNINENVDILHEEFSSKETESHIIEHSLEGLKKFCSDKINNVPDGTFNKFADAAGFDHDKLTLSPDGNIRIVDDLPILRNKFLEKEGIVLGKTATEHAEHILTPEYNPTERMMVTIAIKKIGKELKGSLRSVFMAQFSLPVDIFSPYQDLLGFKDMRTQFFLDHAGEVDESLAKKLDSIIVTNGDIYAELLDSGRKFDETRGFSEREQYFRRIFNRLVTRQLFDEVQKTQETIDHYITALGDTFKQFPPYINTILEIYPFNDKLVAADDTSFHADLERIDMQVVDLNARILTISDEGERKSIRDQIRVLKQQREQRKRQAYIHFMRSKDMSLADIFAQLVANGFSFPVLSQDQQQYILDVLIKHKLEDTIKNKVPELLDVKEEELTNFVDDLFNLQKMDVTIPTRQGPVVLKFLKKEFMASARKQLPTLDDLEDIQNIPLNFVTQLTEANSAFFEESPIFDSIYTDFTAKNGNVRLNDAYKVRIKKDGKTVEGYLSSYSPIDERNLDQNQDGKELYLYSDPITSPNQERTLINRPHEEGKSEIPVVIKNDEQSSCEIDILDKKINLNGEAFGALLFGYVLGQQSMNTSLSPKQEEEIAKKFGALTVYKEKEEDEEEPEPITKEVTEHKEDISEQKKFFDEWQKLKGYGFPEDATHHGLVPGTVLYMPFSGSGVPPESVGNAWLQMEIIHVNPSKGTFTVKIRGGELRLGKTEGTTKELPMTVASLEGIKKAFGDIYKIPSMKGKPFSEQLTHAIQFLSKDIEKSFGSLKYDGAKFVYSLGNYAGKDVTHFGLYEQKPIGEEVDQESGKMVLYKITPNPNGTITVSGDSMKNNYARHFPSRDMDYVSFMLFVKEKGLQPKCKDQVDDISKRAAATKEETPTTVRGFSINNIVGFFKNGVSKLKDSIKKYDDERTEELTDIMTSQGLLRTKVGGFLSPFSRISESFENMGREYFLERDSRIWKKIEKWTKFYEDFDYTKLYNMYIGPMLRGELAIKPHYKIAAMLLVHLKKGKGPYAKNLPTAEGQWVGMLLGKDHQQRYLAIREKRIRDLEQNAHVYGGPWADQIKNELVELEMRYIVHVMDGRHMGMGDDVKYYFQNKYSKKFCDELEGAYTGFFNQNTVEEGFTKNKDVNFEFARVEYFRQLADRPQQALPFLKVMATKAINDSQWQVFETAVLAGMLSGVFLNMTYGSTQSFIQKICRTRGFIPGILAKDIKQQTKIQRLLDLFSGGQFTKATNYNSADFSFRVNKGPGKFIESFIKWTDGTIKVHGKEIGTRNALSKFFDLTGTDVQDKTIIDYLDDPKLPLSDKLLIREFIDKTNEKNEALDTDVQNNTSSLTGSILTKSQSVVEQMIKIDQDGFAGKDGDAKSNMEAFSGKMKDAIPLKESIASESKINFFLEKFFNRFSAFSGNKKTEFLKRLIRCQQNKGSGEIDDIMYYSVAGEIILSVARPPAHVPDELDGALNARKEFFINNLDMILRPSVVSASFGGQYVGDLTKYTPALIPREDSAMLLDREDKVAAMYGLSKDEQQPLKDIQHKLRNPNYINRPLYDLADSLSKRCGVNNRFRKEISLQKNSSYKSRPSKATGAKIKNPDVIEKIKKILDNKPLDENAPGYMPEIPYDDYTDYGMAV